MRGPQLEHGSFFKLYTFQQSENPAHGTTISNNASVAGNTPDWNPGNNSSTATTSVINRTEIFRLLEEREEVMAEGLRSRRTLLTTSEDTRNKRSGRKFQWTRSFVWIQRKLS